MKTTIYFATKNQHKIQQIDYFLKMAQMNNLFHDIEMKYEDEEILSVEETGMTFIENAILKARNLSYQMRNKFYVMADDSGIIVHALDNAPGVFSQRYASMHHSNLPSWQLLLNNMEDIIHRDAQMVSCIVLMKSHHDSMPLINISLLDGHITHEPRGTSQFGYENIFQIKGSDMTLGQIPDEEKIKLFFANQLFHHRFTSLKNILSQIDNN